MADEQGSAGTLEEEGASAGPWTAYPTTKVSERTVRLIPTRFPPVPAFESVAAAEDLDAVMELEGWTNDRLVAERAARLGVADRAYGRPNASVVMASFLHAHPDGGRFNSSDLGAWYASLTERTAIAEVAAGLRREARRTGLAQLDGAYRAYAATLEGDRYADLRGEANERASLLDPGSWATGQVFGEAARAGGGDGIVYPSVRHAGGTNVVAYRPNKVADVTIASTFVLTVPIEGRVTARRIA